MDLMGRQWTTTVYENQGHVWQAEEGFIDGKWQRFFGFVGDHIIARAPGEEIEFPGRWPWQELDNGFDCHVSAKGYSIHAPLPPGAPIPLTVWLRNRRGIDQDGPATLYKSDAKAFASGVEIHLYRKNEPAPAQIVKESPDATKTTGGWVRSAAGAGGVF
jgi:hypothetical protein